MRLYIIIAILLFLTRPALAQMQVPDSPRYILPLLNSSRPDTNKVALLNRLAGYYIFKPGNYKFDLDSALKYLDAALLLSKKLQSTNWVNETLKLTGDCYLEADGPVDVAKGGDCFKQVAEYYHSTGESLKEARTWSRYAQCLSSRHYPEKKHCLRIALALYQQLSVKPGEETIETLKQLADVHLCEGYLDSAEHELSDVIAQYKSIGYPSLQYSYDLLAEVYRLEGYPKKYLESRMQCLQSMYESNDTSDVLLFTEDIADAYYRLGFHKQAIFYAEKVINHAMQNNADSIYYFAACRDKAFMLAESGHSEQAIDLLNALPKTTSKGNLAETDIAYALSYHYIGQLAIAEKYYLDVYKQSPDMEIYGSEHNFGSITFSVSIASLYLDMGRFDKARSIMRNIGTIRFALLSAAELSRYYKVEFKLDSAAGNYIEAIQNYTRYKQLNDSVFNATKNRQVQELEISYETKQKEASIKDLQNKDKVRQAELTKANAQKRLILVGSGLLLIIAVLAFVGLRQKQRSNRLLEEHQQEIDEKNLSLESLNQRQALLLKEKEWLIREIHHRVKNNLQTTIGLLHMQSAYLSNEHALTAIRNSQHRLQAMSLIHQRLYQSDDMTSVEMSSYITELVTFLRESYRGIDNITFDFLVEPVVFDISVAIPLGLIINEAITNAIKYAFPDGRTGKVSISLHAAAGDNFLLTIADNGIGLPDTPAAKSNSLGLNLIAGLTDQIQGDLRMLGDNGTTILIIFKQFLLTAADAMERPKPQRF
jgi:two-component system, sensor histidine kinase PdtaS